MLWEEKFTLTNIVKRRKKKGRKEEEILSYLPAVSYNHLWITPLKFGSSGKGMDGLCGRSQVQVLHLLIEFTNKENHLWIVHAVNLMLF